MQLHIHVCNIILISTSIDGIRQHLHSQHYILKSKLKQIYIAHQVLRIMEWCRSEKVDCCETMLAAAAVPRDMKLSDQIAERAQKPLPDYLAEMPRLKLETLPRFLRKMFVNDEDGEDAAAAGSEGDGG